MNKNYAIAMLPITIAMLIPPPLSYLQGKEIESPFAMILTPIYNLIPIKYLNERFFMSLALLQSKNMYQQPWYRWLTSQLIHSDYNHLFCNLIGTIQLGSSVYQNMVYLDYIQYFYVVVSYLQCQVSCMRISQLKISVKN